MNYTKEDIDKECDKKGLKLIDIVNVNCGSKTRRSAVFICSKHEKYGEQTKAVEKIFSAKQPCQYCNHSRLDITLQNEIDERIELLTTYKRWDLPVRCKCRIHGEEWDGLSSVLLNGGTGCKECIKEKKMATRRKTTEEFKKEVEEIRPTIEVIGEYNGTHKPIKCKCKIHDVIWESYACNIKNGTAGCPECASESMSEKSKLSEEEINMRLQDTLPHIHLIDSYKNMKIKTMFHCDIHNCDFDAIPRSLLYGKIRGCPYCVMTRGETKLYNYLHNTKRHNIIYQCKFSDCKYVNVLRFDFYDVDDDVLYEYQGEQHYMPVGFGGIDDENAKNEFIINKERDSVKRKYCKEHNIKLIEIPYWEYDNMEQYIENQLIA